MANSVDPDQTLRSAASDLTLGSAASDLGLHSLQRGYLSQYLVLLWYTSEYFLSKQWFLF